jgi:uncharacterized repeat protein (TIGR01451 family)
MAFSPVGGLLATANNGTVSMLAPTGPFEIRKVAAPRQVAPGKVVKYTITLRPAESTGAGGDVIDDLTVALQRASYLDDARASTGTVRFNAAIKRLVWSGTLAPGEQATIAYSMKVRADARGLVANRVTGPPGSTCAPPAPPELPCMTLTPIVPPPASGADLALSKTASAGTAHPGGQVMFALAVANHGPADATGVTVQDPVPSGLFFDSGQPSQGSCTLDAARLVCRLGSVPGGGQALVLVTATVAADARGMLVNQAGVYGDQQDPVPANNTASSTLTVSPLPPPQPPPAVAPEPGPQPVSDVVVSRPVGQRVARVGHRLSYTIT